MIELVESFEVLEMYEVYDEYISKKWERKFQGSDGLNQLDWLEQPT